MTTRSKTAALLFMLFAFGAVMTEVGCSDADSVSAVNVTLREFSVTPDRSEVPNGTVNFHVTNAGTVNHEFLVIRTDLSAAALPTAADGSYAENGTGTSLLEEVEEIAPGQSRDVSIDLTDGNYVLICNMVHVVNGVPDSHYARGMRASFRVD